MNEHIKEALSILEALKLANPEMDFSSLEESLLNAKKEDEEIFYAFTKEDLSVCFDEINDQSILRDLSEDIKNEFVEELFIKVKNSFDIPSWKKYVFKAIKEPILKNAGHYYCKNISVEWAEKWERYKEVVKSIDPSILCINSNNDIEKINLDEAFLYCVQVLTECDMADEIDSALDEIRAFERDGFISYEQYESIHDILFLKCQ